MAAHLEDWEIVVDRQGAEKLAFGMTDNPFQDTEATTFGFSWTNAAHGGCGKASVNLMSQSAPYLAGLDLLPDDRLLIRLQCGDESSLKDRYVGMIRRVGLGYGTEPKIRTLEANGIVGQFRKIPLFMFKDNATINAIMIAVIADLADKSDVTDYSSYITYGTGYTVALTDFFNQYADRAIKRLADLAGPDCVWGVVPGDSATPTDARFYFQQLGDTAEDLGFEVDVNVEDAEGSVTRDRILNGMLVTCQRKIGGGDLWMFIPPATGSIPYRVGLERVPELVDPVDAYAWAQAKLNSFPSNDEKISFKVPDFGEQIWANEIINTPLTVALVGGGADYEIMCRSYTTTVDGSGSVDTEFALGTLPSFGLGEQFGDLYRDTIVAKAREFWSGAELAARDSDVIRDWRRDAAKDHEIMNFWGANLDNIESLLSKGDWNDLGIEEPASFYDYSWDYDAEKQRVQGPGSSGQGCVCTVTIPTGLPAGSAIGYVKTAGATYKATSTADWDWDENPEPNSSWFWALDWWGIHPWLNALPTNTWKCQTTLLHKFVSGVPEQPLKVWCGRVMQLFDSSTPTTYGAFKTLTSHINICFALDGKDPATTAAYCLRVHRRNGESRYVRCALGWIDNGVFHSNWWDAGATSDSQAAGTFDLKSGDDKTMSFELDVWLPEQGGSGTYRVRIRKEQGAQVLWDSNTIHGDGEVSASAPSPVACYYAGMIWYKAEGKDNENHPFGIKEVEVESPGNLSVAFTRDGEYWTVGSPETLLPLFGDTYQESKRQLRMCVNLALGNSIRSWGVGFKLDTAAVSMAWDSNFGDDGTGNGEFKQPRDCAVDSDYIYVSDYNNHRIQLLTNTDPPVYSAQFGSSGTGDPNFDHPWGIDLDNTYMYIADSSNKRIKVHLKASPYTFIRSIGSGTLTHNPYGLTVAGRVYDADDLLYVACADDYVWIFKKDGTYVDKFAGFSDLGTAACPCDVRISDDENYLYVTNPGDNTFGSVNNCIRKFLRASPYTQIWTWGKRGQNPDQGEWEYPYGVCRLGDLVVVSAGSNAVTPSRNCLVTLADRGSYVEYLDHVDGSGGEAAGGFLQMYAGDIEDNRLYCAETGYCQIKIFELS